LPPRLFTHLELHPGGVVAWRLEDDEVVLMGVDAGLRRARELLGIDLDEPGESLVDMLIRERREDARKEEEDERRYLGA
jgi:hypothetical protein